jgi:hypothetical protein
MFCSVRNARRLVHQFCPVAAKFKAPFVPSSIRHGTVISVELPHSEDQFITKDLRSMTNAHFLAFDAHKRIVKMAKFWGVFPGVVPEFPALVNLVVSFGPSRFDTVYRGNSLSVEQVQHPPEVVFPLDKTPRTLISENMSFTLLLVDAGPAADEVPRPHEIHWLVANIPGNDISQGETMIDYKPAYPVNGGNHRFVFVLMQQVGPLSASSVNVNNFHTRSFISENNMKPCGLSFYQAGQEVIEQVVTNSKIKQKYQSPYCGL